MQKLTVSNTGLLNWEPAPAAMVSIWSAALRQRMTAMITWSRPRINTTGNLTINWYILHWWMRLPKILMPMMCSMRMMSWKLLAWRCPFSESTGSVFAAAESAMLMAKRYAAVVIRRQLRFVKLIMRAKRSINAAYAADFILGAA